MRGSARMLACVLAVLFSVGAVAGVRTMKRLDGVEPGTRVRMEGVVSIRGSTPFTLLVLEDGDGGAVTIQAHTDAIRQDLTSLEGVRLAVEGAVLPPRDAALPQLDVDRYEILASPAGGDPIVGRLSSEDGACVLTTSAGARYWIVGELAAALCEHAGARVWMVGKKTKRADGARPAGAAPFTPTGYGVISH